MEQIKELVVKGKYRQIAAVVQCALDHGSHSATILQAMTEAMETVGKNFQEKEIFVPEMLIAAKTMKEGLEVLKPHLRSEAPSCEGKVIIGTVAGDLHDIGKNLVCMLLESAGIAVVDLGVDAPVEKFLDTYEANPDTRIIACSALLTTTLPAMKTIVEAINAAPWRDQVTVMVGGGPITREFAEQIGADIYTEDAASAAQKVREILALFK